MHRLLAPVLVGLLTACSPQARLEGFPEDLALEGGCADVVLFATNDADTLMLTVEGDGLVAEAEAAGEATPFEFTLPDEQVEVRVEVGRRVSDATCDDVVEDGGPSVEQTYVASSGTVTLTVIPGSDTSGATSSVQLEDLQFPSGPSHLLLLDTFAIEDVAVGWFPG